MHFQPISPAAPFCSTPTLRDITVLQYLSAHTNPTRTHSINFVRRNSVPMNSIPRKTQLSRILLRGTNRQNSSSLENSMRQPTIPLPRSSVQINGDKLPREKCNPKKPIGFLWCWSWGKRDTSAPNNPKFISKKFGREPSSNFYYFYYNYTTATR